MTRRDDADELVSPSEGVHVLSADGTMLYENAAAAAMFGCEPGDMLGRPMHALTHHHRPDGTPYPLEACPIHRTLCDGRVRRITDEVFFRRDGRAFPVAYTVAPIKDSGGRVIGAVVGFQAVGAERHARDDLKEQAVMLANAERIGKMGSWNMDLTTGRLYWSDATCHLFGIEPAEFRGTFEHFCSFILPEDRAAFDAAQARVHPGTGPLEGEYRIRRPDGQIRWLYERGDVEFDASGRQIRRLGMVMDITEQRAAREQLERHASLLRIAGRVAQLGGWTIDLPERRLTWSDEICDMHDLPRGGTRSLEDGLEFFAPESRPVINALLERCIRDGVPYDVELEKVTAKGRRIWVRTIGQAVRDAEGRIVRIEGAIQDITDRKRTELLLREQAALLNKARDAIIVRTLDNRIAYWNESAERIYGYSAADALGRPVNELLYRTEAGQDAFRRADLAVREDGEWSGELEQRTKSGQAIIVEGRWTLVRDEAGRPVSVLAINTDVTERRALERQILRAQRMESIGTLAGGIAHDLNNVLTPIMMSIDLLRDGDLSAAQRDTIAAIESSARKGADMIRQILSFARGVEGRRVEVDVERLIGDVLRIAKDTFFKSIRIDTRIEPALPPVIGDPTQLHQVLLNLCVNARDAMPDGGRITVDARTADLEALPPTAPPESRPGRYVVISVTDTGTGMPAEVVDRIFEPFFTTKESGRGTGLGLSASLAIVRSHGGFFEVLTAPGRGSTFFVHLPATVRTEAVAADERESSDKRGRGELILVIEDNAMVRDVTRRMLETFGYRVALAADGREGVAEFEARRGEVRAVLTDMMMPVMDGAATIRAIRAIDPSVPCVAVSGMDHRAETLRDVPGARRVVQLRKPYTADQLLEAIRTALDTPA